MAKKRLTQEETDKIDKWLTDNSGYLYVEAPCYTDAWLRCKTEIKLPMLTKSPFIRLCKDLDYNGKKPSIITTTVSHTPPEWDGHRRAMAGLRGKVGSLSIRMVARKLIEDGSPIGILAIKEVMSLQRWSADEMPSD
jgi:hypothetical protein